MDRDIESRKLVLIVFAQNHTTGVYGQRIEVKTGNFAIDRVNGRVRSPLQRIVQGSMTLSSCRPRSSIVINRHSAECVWTYVRNPTRHSRSMRKSRRHTKVNCVLRTEERIRTERIFDVRRKARQCETLDRRGPIDPGIQKLIVARYGNHVRFTAGKLRRFNIPGERVQGCNRIAIGGGQARYREIN